MNKKKAVIITGVVVILATAIVFLWWNQGSAERAQEKLDLAIKYLSDNKYEQAILAYNDAIKIDPKAVKAYQGLARVYTLQEKYDEAKDTYDQGIEAVTPEDQVVLQLGLGGMYIDQGQMEAAQKTFQQIKDGNARCLEAYWGLAMVYKQKNDTAQAEAMLKLAVEQNPNEYRAYNALALYQQQNGQAAESFNNLVKSLSLEVNQQEAYLVLNDLYKGNWPELRSKAPQVSSQQIADVLEFFSYYAAKDYQNAVNIYEAKIKKQANNYKAQILAAIAMSKNGNTEQAEELIRELANKDINDWLLSDIAEYYLASGDDEKAKFTAIKALEANSTNLDAMALLQRINANDKEGQIYAAEYLMYNWKPVKEVKQTMAESEIKTFVDTDTNIANKAKVSDQNLQQNTDPKLVLLQDAAAYFKGLPSCKDLNIVPESPYGSPQNDDYVVMVGEFNKSTATITFGLWGTDMCSDYLFKRLASGRWEYVRELPQPDSLEASAEKAPKPAAAKPLTKQEALALIKGLPEVQKYLTIKDTYIMEGTSATSASGEVFYCFETVWCSETHDMAEERYTVNASTHTIYKQDKMTGNSLKYLNGTWIGTNDHLEGENTL